MKQPLQSFFEILGGHGAFRGVGYSLFAKVIEGEGTGRGEAAAPGLIQDHPHQLQRNLGLGFRLLHGDTRLSSSEHWPLYGTRLNTSHLILCVSRESYFSFPDSRSEQSEAPPDSRSHGRSEPFTLILYDTGGVRRYGKLGFVLVTKRVRSLPGTSDREGVRGEG